MKKRAFICVIIVFLLLLGVNGYAQDKDSDTARNSEINYEKTPLNKLGRGVVNVLTCWAEIPGEVVKVSSEKNELAGITLGVAEGMFTSLIRGITGLFDTVTFIIPPYNRPLMEPEYAWQSMIDKCEKYNPQ